MPTQKIITFISSSKKSSNLLYSIYRYAHEQYKSQYKAKFKRFTHFFLLEILFAIQKNLPKEIVQEISEYSYRKYVAKKPEYFFTRYLFNILGKCYFIKAYTFLKNSNTDVLYIFDDTSIINKATIFAAKILKLEIKILHQGYRNNTIFIDSNATRWNNSIPRNVEFYYQIKAQKIHITEENNHTDDIVLVLMQDDFSPETLLYSPLFVNQKQFLATIKEVAKEMPKTKFIIFNNNSEEQDTKNLLFTKKTFQEFLPFCKCVITINNQEALFALEELKPIITIGNAYFNIEGIAVSVASTSKLITTLQNIHQFQIDKLLINNFLYCVNDLYAIQCSNVENPTIQDKTNFIEIIN